MHRTYEKCHHKIKHRPPQPSVLGGATVNCAFGALSSNGLPVTHLLQRQLLLNESNCRAECIDYFQCGIYAHSHALAYRKEKVRSEGKYRYAGYMVLYVPVPYWTAVLQKQRGARLCCRVHWNC